MTDRGQSAKSGSRRSARIEEGQTRTPTSPPKVNEHLGSCLAFLSVCSGLLGLEWGLLRRGVRCLGVVEKDDDLKEIARQQVLRMTDKLPGAWSDTGHYLFNSTFDGEVSLVSGGTPCEDVSARGLREGPKGLLSCLWQDLLGWVDAVKAPRILWENVLGALGTQCPKRGKGCQCEKDGEEESLLGCLIKELEKREFHWAYR